MPKKDTAQTILLIVIIIVLPYAIIKAVGPTIHQDLDKLPFGYLISWVVPSPEGTLWDSIITAIDYIGIVGGSIIGYIKYKK